MNGLLVNKNAIFSDCRKYRYALSRTWNGKKKTILFIGLNPSTADEKIDDPTIRRCINYAQNWGYGSLLMVNLFAYRATLPSELKNVKNPIGNDNDLHILELSKKADLTVAAWGNEGFLLNRDKVVKKLIPNLMCLKINKSGQPSHPLYQKKDLKLIKYS
ncbi:MAG: DUF1643 domain-containing protein [Candidatus Thioglobus sp.]|nr:DUF1643 domain-containing protein [Candidatus Thioglobus sp.]